MIPVRNDLFAKSLWKLMNKNTAQQILQPSATILDSILNQVPCKFIVFWSTLREKRPSWKGLDACLTL